MICDCIDIYNIFFCMYDTQDKCHHLDIHLCVRPLRAYAPRQYFQFPLNYLIVLMFVS